MKVNNVDQSFAAVRSRIEGAFARQSIMQEMAATLTVVEEGRVEIVAPFDSRFCQQDGFWHAGIVTTLVDSATGFAAYSTMPEGKRVLAVEFKMNFLRPAVGERFRAVGQVVRAGRSLVVVTGEVFAEADGEEKMIAINQSTMMAVDEAKEDQEGQ